MVESRCTVGAEIKFWFGSRATAVKLPDQKMTNITVSVSQCCCYCRDVAFTLVSKYTVRFRKRFHRLYGIEHEVLYLRRVCLSLETNIANTRLKTQVLFLFLCGTTFLLVAPRGRTAVRQPLPCTLDLSVKSLRLLLAVCHAHSTRVIMPIPLDSGTKCNSCCWLCWYLLRTHLCAP